MAAIVEWEGEPFALLIETPEGGYLVPPIVLGEDGRPIEGREVLAAVVQSGKATEIPVIRGVTPAGLAEIDQRMAQLSSELGVPLHPDAAG